MSLYQLQKFLFDINRDRDLQRQCRADLPGVLNRYDLSGELSGGALEGRRYRLDLPSWARMDSWC